MLGQARAEAKARQVDAGKNNGRGQIASAQMGGSYKQAEFTSDSRQQIAEAVGMAKTTLRRAQDVASVSSQATPRPMCWVLLLPCSVVEHPTDRQNLLARNMQYIE